MRKSRRILFWRGSLLGIEQVIKIWTHQQIYKYNKLEFFRENETYKILLDFEVQTDRLILTRKPDLVQINKKNKRLKNSRNRLGFRRWGRI